MIFNYLFNILRRMILLNLTEQLISSIKQYLLLLLVVMIVAAIIGLAIRFRNG